MRGFVLLTLIVSLNSWAKNPDLCQSALTRIGDCLALQSDFNDAIHLKSRYKSDSSCIEGVNFFSGIADEDANSLRSTYQVDVISKGDPLSRADEYKASQTTKYCSGDIKLLVRSEMQKVSIVFHVAANTAKSNTIPEISIEF